MEDEKEPLTPLSLKLEELVRQIDTPDPSYKDSSNPDGTKFSLEQQIEATKKEIRISYSELLTLGASSEELEEMWSERIKQYYIKNYPK